MTIDSNKYLEELKRHFEKKSNPRLDRSKEELDHLVESNVKKNSILYVYGHTYPKNIEVSDPKESAKNSTYQWISVKERRPAFRESVGFVFADGEIIFDKIWYDHCSDKWMEDCPVNVYTRCKKNITHWMPLPLPPEGK